MGSYFQMSKVWGERCYNCLMWPQALGRHSTTELLLVTFKDRLSHISQPWRDFAGWKYMELLRKSFCTCWGTCDPSVLQSETPGPNQPLVLSGCPSESGFRHIGTLHWRFPGCTCSVDKESISVFSAVSSTLVTAQPMQPATTWNHLSRSLY